ncbi:MAG: Omp28-related outer membrane protein [Candidatus Syntrophosphaera sp.]|nr:Omp28-related outer membrane protein [Candidatus Syntrophosphaera sp.]
MKKSILLMLVLFSLLAALNAVPRNLVVVEVATGTWCVYCPGAAMGCHDLLTNGHPVAIVKNHNGDSYANVYSNARNSYYAVTGYPTAYFDGLNPTVGGNATSSMYSNYLPKVTARMAVPSHYTISALGSQNGAEYQVLVTVAKPEADTNTNVKLHAVFTESDIPQVWFNQTTVDNVNRLMIPDQNGTAINLDTGESTTVNLTFTPNASWNIANSEMVFFLQNQTSKEILQGVKYSVAALVGAYPVSHETIAFPDMYVTGSSTVPITIVNFASTTATGTIAIDNPVFTSSASTFSIPPTESVTVDITFTPTAAQNYTGTLSIVGNLYNHPNITIPLSGTGFNNSAPEATGVVVSGPPVLYQAQTGSYNFVDSDGNTEGASIYQWFRIMGTTPVAIAGATELTYSAVEEDLDLPLAFQVTPVDQHGMPGTPVMSAYTLPIEVLPAPQNFTGTVILPSNVLLTWERPEHFDGRGLIGYRLYRNGLNISTITSPATLSFTDTYLPDGTHEYWICSMFNDPYMLSGPSESVFVTVGVVDNDDQVAPARISVNVFPNPFQNNTTFSVQSKAGEAVNLSIYNLKGQLVKSFDLKADAAGNASLNWNGTDANGSRVQNGIYHFRMNTANQTRQGRIVLMK